MELTYFGHSAFQIETNGTTILVDPFLTDNPHTDVSPGALNPDVILLTHAHFDHWGDVPAIAQRTGALVISNFEIVGRLGEQHDHENTQPLNEGGTVEFDWGSVTATHARHTSSFPDGSYGGTPNGHVLQLEGETLYNAGDTAPFAEMEWIGDDYDVSLAILPIGDVFTMGFDGSLLAADLVNPARVMPVHYDTFPPIKVDLGEWAEMMDEAGFETEMPDFGASFTL